MSATWNALGKTRRILRWTTLAGLLATTVALGATSPAAAHDNDWNNGWNWRHRHHHRDWDNGGYYYRERPRHYYRDRYYYPPAYYYPPPAYYYPRPYYRPYYEPSFSFGLTIPID